MKSLNIGMSPYKFLNSLNEREINFVLEVAAEYRNQKMQKKDLVTSPGAAAAFAREILGHSSNEQFLCLFLDNQNWVIEAEVLFQGTINSCAVYPRVIAQKALQYNAASVILAHNHPSGSLEPSEADEYITRKIRKALAVLEMKVLDHIIVGGSSTYSFSENGNMSLVD